MSWGQPRSLQARQLLAASLGLVAFLALAGYALDRAFLQTAESNLRQRLESYALAYADGQRIRPQRRVHPAVRTAPTRASNARAAACMPRSCCRNGALGFAFRAGPGAAERRACSRPNEERFEGPLPITEINGSAGEVYRYGRGLVWSAEGDAASRVPVHDLHPRRHHRAQHAGRACSARRCGVISAAPA